jgi:hypothetical protein
MSVIDMGWRQRQREPITDEELEGRLVSGPLFLATSICQFDPRCAGDGGEPCRLHKEIARHALMLCQTPEQAAISCPHGWECPECEHEAKQ